MIGVEGQYIFQVSIRKKRDFISEANLRDFLIIEEANNTLPVFELEFTIEDDELLLLFNEGNELSVGFGKTKNNLEETSLHITKVLANNVGKGQRLVKLYGLLSKPDYLGNPEQKVYPKLSGVEVLKSVASKYFTPDFNVDTSSDVMNWACAQQTGKSFVDDVWMHSYIPNSFLSVGISFDSRFILRDMSKLLKSDFKWRLVPRVEGFPEDSRNIVYDPDPHTESDSGFLNYFAGYGKQKCSYSIEDGVCNIEEFDALPPVMALMNNLPRTQTVGKRLVQNGFLNANVHKNYQRAFFQNLINLSCYSSNRLKLSFTKMNKIQPLDLVMHQDTEVADPSNPIAEYHSGLYVVGKTARNIGARQVTTSVELCKESFNSLKGSFR